MIQSIQAHSLNPEIRVVLRDSGIITVSIAVYELSTLCVDNFKTRHLYSFEIHFYI